MYDPYGGTAIEHRDGANWVRTDVSKYGNPLLWQSQRYDAGVKLYHFAFRTYSPQLGRWLQRDPLGYVDGVNLYEYVRSRPTVFIDPFGLKTCHIWVYFPANGDREPAGDLFVYNADGRVVFYTPVRGRGLTKTPTPAKDRTKEGHDTPTGDYDAKLEGPQGDRHPHAAYGVHGVVRLTGHEYREGGYGSQPQIAGELVDAKAERPGLLIHGGRVGWAKDASGTVYDVKKQKWQKNVTFRKPANTGGCLRCYEDQQERLIWFMKNTKGCDQWIVHVRNADAPKDPGGAPDWEDPRDCKEKAKAPEVSGKEKE